MRAITLSSKLTITVFLRSDVTATIFSQLVFVWLLFEGGVYSLVVGQGSLSGIIGMRVHIPRILAVVTTRGQHLFRSELPIVRLLFEGGVYLKKYGIN